MYEFREPFELHTCFKPLFMITILHISFSILDMVKFGIYLIRPAALDLGGLSSL
jgi:hypothetical protein